MINLGEKSPAPDVLSRQKIVDALDHLRQQYAANGTISGNDFNRKHYWTEVKEELSDYQYGKCCFCERGRDSNGETDVEHYRPKNSNNGKPAPGHSGYWWLAYEWNNLFFSCKECNSQRFKGNEFPLADENTRAQNEGDDLNNETPVFFDLINENPEKYIAYNWVEGLPLPTPKPDEDEIRTKSVIDILGLARRPNLAEGRLAKLKNMQANAYQIHYFETAENKDDKLLESIELLKVHTSSKSNHAGFARYFYKSHGLGKHINE